MSVSQTTRVSFPYLVDDRFHFTLYGRWCDGGWLEVTYDGELVALIRLPRSKWAVLAILALKAKGNAHLDPVDAFVSSAELRRQLRTRTPLRYSGPQSVNRFVCDLRRLLTDSDASQLDRGEQPGPDEWGHRLVESKKALGYRLGVHPKNFEVHLLEELAEPSNE
jgi:hypothetical protein